MIAPRVFFYALAAAAGALHAPSAAAQPAPRELDRYNVSWDAPGRTDRDSMPLGNGEVGISVWVEGGGDLQFYIARTDALTELDHTVKLGKVRVRLTPNPFVSGTPFLQRLVLRQGRAEIEAGGVRLRVFVDVTQPVIYVDGSAAQPVTVSAVYRTWRTQPVRDAASGVVQSADVVEARDGGVLFYHANGDSVVRHLAGQQGLGDHLDAIVDTLRGRRFGGWMTLTGAGKADGAGALTTAAPTRAFTLKIATHSALAPSLPEWEGELRRIGASAGTAGEAAQRTASWWENYWSKSWIFASGSPEAERVTAAYVLTKWMFACTRGGNFPMLFNGGLFNLMPAGDGKIDIFTLARNFGEAPAAEPTAAVNPDIRAWGHMNLYQNQRLPYLSMAARGEAEWLRILFAYYRRFWDLNRVRAKVYYEAAGQHNTEITQSFGLQPGGVYGYDRKGLKTGYSANRWGGAIDISPGLELTHLMLDYFDYTADRRFLDTEVLPYAQDLLQYIETRFRGRRDGRIVIAPLQSVETYWDTTDPLPVVAGMRAVAERILALPAGHVRNREFFVKMRAMTPDLPMETVGGRALLAPAREYKPERHNVEAPVFYAIFPFRLYGLEKPDLDTAIASFRHGAEVAGSFQPFQIGWRPDTPGYSGWQHHGMVAALLGLSAEAREVVTNNSRLNNPGNRFPAMWGPVYDAVPDIDHGANILSTLQLMAFQAERDRVLVLPAWPRDWDVSFQLHGPGGTVVRCRYRGGKVESLDVTPRGRAAAVRVVNPAR